MKNILLMISLLLFSHTTLLAMKRAHSVEEDLGNKRSKTSASSELDDKYLTLVCDMDEEISSVPYKILKMSPFFKAKIDELGGIETLSMHAKINADYRREIVEILLSSMEKIGGEIDNPTSVSEEQINPILAKILLNDFRINEDNIFFLINASFSIYRPILSAICYLQRNPLSSAQGAECTKIFHRSRPELNLPPQSNGEISEASRFSVYCKKSNSVLEDVNIYDSLLCSDADNIDVIDGITSCVLEEEPSPKIKKVKKKKQKVVQEKKNSSKSKEKRGAKDEKKRPVNKTINSKKGQRSKEKSPKQVAPPKKEESKNIFSCSYPGCDHTSTRKYNMTVHERTHSGEKPYECNEPGCDFTTAQEYRLRLHKEKAHIEFRCNKPNCGFIVRNEREFKIHNQEHAGKRVYKCSICNFVSLKEYNRDVHERGHSEEKPFKCSKCEYTANQEDLLKIHVINKHGGEKPHKCTKCDYATAQKSKLDRHMLTHKKRK